MAFKKDLGPVSAYAIAVAHGYTGTEEQFVLEQTNAAIYAQESHKAADDAALSKRKAEEAAQAATGVVDGFEATVEAGKTAIDNKAEDIVGEMEATREAQIELVNEAGRINKTGVVDAGVLKTNEIQAVGAEMLARLRNAGVSYEGAVATEGSKQIALIQHAVHTEVGQIEEQGATQASRVEDQGDQSIQAVQDAQSDAETAIEEKTDDQLARIPEITDMNQRIDDFREKLVMVQDDQPDEEENKLWFTATEPEEVTVPTWAEFEAATEKLDKVVDEDVPTLQNEVKALKARPGIDPSFQSRLENLEAVAEGYLYREQVDYSVAYTKNVPPKALPWATLDEIGVKTLTWHQFVKANTYVTQDGWSTQGILDLVVDEDGVASFYTTSSASFMGYSMIPVFGHVYAFIYDVFIEQGPDNVSVRVRWLSENRTVLTSRDKWTRIALTITVDTELDSSSFQFVRGVGNFKLKNCNIFDLTLMFGKGNEPTIQEFSAMFPAESYTYSEPVLMSFNPDKIVSRGRNLLSGDAFKEVLLAEGFITSATGPTTSISGTRSSGRTLLSGIFKPATQYTIYLKARFKNGSNGPNGPSNFRVMYTDGSYDPVYSTRSPEMKTVVTVTSPGKTVSSIAGVNQIASAFSVEFDGFGIVEGVWSDSDFVPMSEQANDVSELVNTYFPDGMRSAGDVHDAFEVDDAGKIWAVKRVGVVSMSSLSYVTQNERHSTVEKLTDAQDGVNVACNRYVGDAGAATRETNRAVCIENDGCVYVYDTAFTDAVSFKSSLGGVDLYYALSTPVRTEVLDPFPAEISVEKGGTLTVENDRGDDFRVPIPNTETFMIALGGA